MRLEPGAVGQIHRLGGDVVDRGGAIVGRRTAEHRILFLRDAAGYAGVGGSEREQSAMRRFLAPQFLNHVGLLAGNSHHSRFCPLRHVADRGAGPRQPGWCRLRRRGERDLHGCRSGQLRLRRLTEFWQLGLRRDFGDLRRLGDARRLALRGERCKPFVKHNRSCRSDGDRRGDRAGCIRILSEHVVDERRRRNAAGNRTRRTPDNRHLVRGAIDRRIDAGAKHVGIDRIAAAQHKARNGRVAFEIGRAGFPGISTLLRLDATGTRTHSPCAQNSSTCPLECRAEKIPARQFAEARSVIKATFS